MNRLHIKCLLVNTEHLLIYSGFLAFPSFKMEMQIPWWLTTVSRKCQYLNGSCCVSLIYCFRVENYSGFAWALSLKLFLNGFEVYWKFSRAFQTSKIDSVFFLSFVRDMQWSWGCSGYDHLKNVLDSQIFSLGFLKPFRECVLLLERKVHECCEQCFKSHVSSGHKEGSKRRKQKQREEQKKKKSTKGSY